MFFDEVGISPESLLHDEVLSTLRDSFGWAEGRLVRKVPKEWKECVLQIANTLPDGLQKTKIKSILSRLPIIDSILSPSLSDSWIDAALAIHEKLPFSALICENEAEIPLCYTPQTLDSYVSDSRRRIGHLDATGKRPSEIVEALAPFLAANKRLVLVNPDQWFYSNRQSSDVFEALLRFWVHSGGVSFTAIRSARAQKGLHHWDSDVQRIGYFLDYIKYNGVFKFYAIPDDAKRLHKRYLIGTLCGIELDYGLEVSNKPQAWSLMREAAYIEQHKRFMVNDVRDEYDQATKSWVYGSRVHR